MHVFIHTVLFRIWVVMGWYAFGWGFVFECLHGPGKFL